MTKNEANRLLDEVRDGNRLHPVVKITEALWATGDCVRHLPVHTPAFSQTSINEWMESSRMAQSEGTGDSPNRYLEEHQLGLNRYHESKK